MKPLLTLIVLIFAFNSHAQFNEQLEKEILAIAKTKNLDGIAKDDALGQLSDISTELTEEEIKANLIGQSWKYSHSVSHEGRQFRLSNGFLILNFAESSDAYYISQKNDKIKVPCIWDYDGLLLMDEYTDEQREKRKQRHYYGVHTLTDDRLVVSKIIQSKSQPGKLAILYHVYFRR